jgi:hypothetical protein
VTEPDRQPDETPDADNAEFGDETMPPEPGTLRLPATAPTPGPELTQRVKILEAPGTRAVDPKAIMRRTARISLKPSDIEDSLAPTRRQTIRVKKSTVRLPDEIASEPPAQTPLATGSPELAAAPSAIHPFFLVTAIATSLVVVALIYVLAAQVLGPNSCLTRLSYYPEGPSLVWFGSAAGR